MYFQSLTLINFQSHKNTTLEFDPRFNCIVGSSNVGKTALSRALSFILDGQWESSWIRHGEKACAIKIGINDGTIVTREKGAKINRYTISRPGQKDVVYENFGTEIPSEVSQTLKIFKVQIDANEFLNLNVCSQLEPLFLLSKTGSFKAKVLGKLSGAHYLDYALRELNKDKRNLQTEKSRKEMEILDLQQQLIKYEGLDGEKTRLEAIGSSLSALELKETHLKSLQSLFNRAQAWKSRFTAESALESQFNVEIPTLETLEATAKRLEILKDLQLEWQKVENSQKRAKTELLDVTSQIQIAKDAYIKVLEEQQTCPTCLSSINETQIAIVRGSL